MAEITADKARELLANLEHGEAHERPVFLVSARDALEEAAPDLARTVIHQANELSSWIGSAVRLGQKLDAAWQALGFDPDRADERSLADEIDCMLRVLADERAAIDAARAEAATLRARETQA